MYSKSNFSSNISILNTLQFGDSFFPSGTIAFSYGLETLVDKGVINSRESLEQFIRSQLLGRWIGFDRPCLVGSYKACQNEDYISRLIEIDYIVNSATLPYELRQGSIRAGAALLGVHYKLGTQRVSAYRKELRSGKAIGHLPIVQGICLFGSGLSRENTELVSAHGLVVGLVSSGIRLGVIGHIDGQRLVSMMHNDIANMLSEDAVKPEESWSFAPVSDIAVMQHEIHKNRLFSN